MSKIVKVFIISFLVSISILTFGYAADIDPGVPNSIESGEMTKDRFEIEAQSLQQLNLLIESFKTEEDYSYPSYNLNFPDYFGGVYINQDCNPVVLLTDTSKSVTDKIKEITGNNAILFKKVSYSLNQLLELNNSVSEICINNSTYKDNTFLQLDEANNKINISIIRTDLDSTKSDEEILGEFILNIQSESAQKTNNSYSAVSDMITLSVVDGSISEEVTLNPGVGVGVTSGTNTFSLGYRAKYPISSVLYGYGYMTAGHAVSAGSDVYYNSADIGYSLSSYHQTSGAIDATFIKLYSGVGTILGTAVNHESGITQSSTIGSYVQGSVVHLSALYNSDMGYVVSTSVTAGDLTCAVSASYLSQAGDSGGLVYTLTGSSANPVGIHCGRFTSSTGESLAYFSSAGVIKILWDIEPY